MSVGRKYSKIQLLYCERYCCNVGYIKTILREIVNSVVFRVF